MIFYEKELKRKPNQKELRTEKTSKGKVNNHISNGNNTIIILIVGQIITHDINMKTFFKTKIFKSKCRS